MPFSFFILLPFAKEILARRSFRNLPKIALVVVLLLVSTWRIFETGKFYHRRVAYLNTIIDDARKNDTQKLLLPRSEVQMQKIHIHWAVPAETLMLSSLDKEKKAVSLFIYDDLKKYEKELINPDYFFYVPWGPKRISHLNSTHFSLPQGPYTLVNNKTQ